MPKQYTEPFDMIGCDFGHKTGKIICPFGVAGFVKFLEFWVLF